MSHDTDPCARVHAEDNPVVAAIKVSSFWMQVERRGPDECWPWKGYTEKGYGKFLWRGRMVGAHELALTFTTGEVRLPNLETCHACDNPICVNPNHLRFDTRQSNVDDMMRRGRHNPNKKLSDEQVVVIRERRAAGATGADLAQQFGVSQALINEIVRGHRRVTVGGPILQQHGNYKHGKYARRSTRNG